MEEKLKMTKLGLYEIHAYDTEWSLEIEYDETDKEVMGYVKDIKEHFDKIANTKNDLFYNIQEINRLIALNGSLKNGKPMIKPIWTRLN